MSGVRPGLVTGFAGPKGRGGVIPEPLDYDALNLRTGGKDLKNPA